MKASRVVLIFWVGIIVALLLVELAEITHFFTLPITSVIGDTVAFVFALVFTTILALVGAIFIGIYIAQRMTSGVGFTPFEVEMLRMRSDVKKMAAELAELSGNKNRPDPESSTEIDPPPEKEARP